MNSQSENSLAKKLSVNHQQQQKDLDHLLPIIEDAGTLIVEKLALFKKYNR